SGSAPVLGHGCLECESLYPDHLILALNGQAPVGQLHRASAFYAEGCRFNPCRVRHSSGSSAEYVVAGAQLVESRIVIPVVAGSSPVGHPTSHAVSPVKTY